MDRNEVKGGPVHPLACFKDVVSSLTFGQDTTLANLHYKISNLSIGSDTPSKQATVKAKLNDNYGKGYLMISGLGNGKFPSD